MIASQDIPKTRTARAFTLIEVLVSMVILAMILLVITSVIGQAQRTWKSATSRLSQFREARQAFDSVTRNLRQAMVNRYGDYLPRDSPFTPPPPPGIVSKADLGIRFGPAASLVSGGSSAAELPGSAVIFQAPLGLTAEPEYRLLKSLLCVRGYYVSFGTDQTFMPAGLSSRLKERFRYRLLEYAPTAETNPIYQPGPPDSWTTISQASGRNALRVVANNIVALILAPTFNSGAVGSTPVELGQPVQNAIYDFNSYADGTFAQRSTKYRMPASTQVVMVAVDEETSNRMVVGNKSPDLLRQAGAQFSDPVSLERDVEKLRAYMNAQRYNFRIFSTNVFLLANDI
jgi:uncharacterized protein (TIGR02599 family)